MKSKQTKKMKVEELARLLRDSNLQAIAAAFDSIGVKVAGLRVGPAPADEIREDDLPVVKQLLEESHRLKAESIQNCADGLALAKAAIFLRLRKDAANGDQDETKAE